MGSRPFGHSGLQPGRCSCERSIFRPGDAPEGRVRSGIEWGTEASRAIKLHEMVLEQARSLQFPSLNGAPWRVVYIH